MINALIIGGVGTLSIAALGIAIFNNNRESEFLYANSKLIAKSRYLLKNENYNRICTGGKNSFIQELKNTDYSQFLIEESNIQNALERGFNHSLYEIKKDTPKKFHLIFDIYNKMNEAKVIKLFIRARKNNKELLDNLIEYMNEFNPILLSHLKQSKSLEDIKIIVRNTIYHNINFNNNIEEIENEIDNKVINFMYNKVSKISPYNKKIITQIMENRINLYRVLNIIKKSIRKNEHFKIEDFFDYKGSIYFKKIDEIHESENYYKIEQLMWRCFYESMESLDLYHSLGPFQILSYIFKKEREKTNLYILRKGLERNSENVMEMII